MHVQAITKNILRHSRIGELCDEERAVISSVVSDVRSYSAGQVVVRQGQEVGQSTLLLEGFMTRHVDAPDGRRHLVAMHVPGDFVDLHGYALKKLDHNVGALTDVQVAVVPHAAFKRILDEYPELTKKLWFLTLLDAALHRQWVYRLASLNAVQRVAHFLCEFNARMMAIDRSDGKTFELPMTQADLGEVCSLTNVHVNRVFRQLREAFLCDMRLSRVEVQNLSALADLGRFTPHYLYLNNRLTAAAVGKEGV